MLPLNKITLMCHANSNRFKYFYNNTVQVQSCMALNCLPTLLSLPFSMKKVWPPAGGHRYFRENSRFVRPFAFFDAKSFDTVRPSPPRSLQPIRLMGNHMDRLVPHMPALNWVKPSVKRGVFIEAFIQLQVVG